MVFIHVHARITQKKNFISVGGIPNNERNKSLPRTKDRILCESKGDLYFTQQIIHTCYQIMYISSTLSGIYRDKLALIAILPQYYFQKHNMARLVSQIINKEEIGSRINTHQRHIQKWHSSR